MAQKKRDKPNHKHKRIPKHIENKKIKKQEDWQND